MVFSVLLKQYLLSVKKIFGVPPNNNTHRNLPAGKAAPLFYYSTLAMGGDFNPEYFVSIRKEFEMKKKMFLCHDRQQGASMRKALRFVRAGLLLQGHVNCCLSFGALISIIKLKK